MRFQSTGTTRLGIIVCVLDGLVISSIYRSVLIPSAALRVR